MGRDWRQDDWVAILRAGARAIQSPESVDPPLPNRIFGFTLRMWVAPSFATCHGLYLHSNGWRRPDAPESIDLRVVTWDQPADGRRLDPVTGATANRSPTLLVEDQRLDAAERLRAALAAGDQLVFQLGTPPEFAMMDGTEAGLQLSHDGTLLRMAWRWGSERTDQAQAWCRRVLTELTLVAPAVRPMLASWNDNVDDVPAPGAV